MVKITSILEGWGNYLLKSLNLLSLDKKRVAYDRLLICDNCKTRTNKICDKHKGGCGCPIKKLILCFSCSCKLHKW